MKRIYFILLFCFIALCSWAQFPYGTTGLLHMPTADMQKDKTLMFGTSYLDLNAVPKEFTYNTFNYYVNITFLSCLEVAYVCTLNKALLGNLEFSEDEQRKYTNQDRQFSIRLRLLKEGQFWKYIPAVVLGTNDPTTSAIKNNNKTPGEVGNGYWNRYYIALTKHATLHSVGSFGIHFAYVYNNRKMYHLNGPCLGIDFQPFFHSPLKFMAEYDARTVNIGLGYSIWKDHINLVSELNECKYPSVGVCFKVHLK